MFHLKAFGGLSLESDAFPVPAAATQRRRLALLALLAGAGERGMSRDKLVALLWPGGRAEKGRHALEQLLYASRRDLGKDVFLSGSSDLRLNPEIIDSDVRAFETALRERDPERAVCCYTGPFLDGVFLPDAPQFERWADEERTRLQGRFAAALEQLAVGATAAADPRAAAGWWRRLAALDPLNAGTAIALMNALAASGDRAGALQHARIHATLVHQELEMEPEAEVMALAERLRTEPTRIAPAQSTPALAPEPEFASPGSPHPMEQWRSRPGTRWAASAGIILLVLTAGAWMLSRREAPTAAPTGSPTTIAVLPFADLSARGDGEYLSDGMAEELIHALSAVPGLQVVARTSAFAFKGRTMDVREIGSALDVEAVLEGSVRQADGRLRVTVQLIDTRNGYHLWSEVYDHAALDIFAVQDEIARAVAERLHPGAAGPGARQGAQSIAAYHHYLRGRYLWNQNTRTSLNEAIDAFHAAIREDSSYAPAFAGLADSYNAQIAYSRARIEQRRLLSDAEAAARLALRLDPGLAEAHASLGHLLVNRWDWEGAELAFRRALDENPGFANAYERYAILLAIQGRFDDGIRMIRRAQELDPLSLNIHGSAGYILNLARRYDQAEPQVRNLVAIDSTRSAPHFRLGSVLLQMERYDEAASEFETAMRLSPSGSERSLPMLGYTYARSGRSADAARLRPEIERGLADNTISGYFAAAYFGAIGERDRAFAVLDSLGQQQESCLQDVGVDPVMDPLRADPRFQRLVRHVGVMDAAP